MFKLDANGKETVLHTFTSGADGSNPVAGVIRDSAGNLYGTAFVGGALNMGTVFKVDRTGKFSVLYSFTGAPDGSQPLAGLLRDTQNNLYNTTAAGDALSCTISGGYGTMFKLDSTGKETVLHTFTGGADGTFPEAAVIRDAAGNLFGTTSSGGGLGGGTCANNGCGTVFKVDSTGKETVLHRFSGPDGQSPFAGLVPVGGILYGTTEFGGAFNFGTVFKVDKTGKETVVYSFAGGADGAYPNAGLISDAAGNLYGTTLNGGASGYGTVFKIAP